MYCPYSMQVTHFLKRKNCKVSLQCVKHVKSKENGKPLEAEPEDVEVFFLVRIT